MVSRSEDNPAINIPASGGGMTVAHLTASRFFGAPEWQMLELAKSLSFNSKSVMISFAEDGLCQAFLDKVRGEGFRAEVLSHDMPRLVAAFGDLLQLLREVKPDVLCCHGHKARLLGLVAAQRLDIPIMGIFHGWTGESLRIRLYESIDRYVLRRMDHIVCVSNAQAKMLRRTGVPSEKVTAIHCAIRAERFDHPKPECRERLRDLFDEPPKVIIGAAGRLSPEKGFDLLVKAAADVVGKDGSVGFVLFGDGPLRDHLANQIASLGLEEKFVLGGFRTDLDALFPHLDLLVLPSYTEGLPNVLLEAFACGVPVVATAVGGTPELVDDGINGLLVPAGNVSALASAITRLTADASLRVKMGTSGRQRVESEFTFTAQAAAYRELFDQYN